MTENTLKAIVVIMYSLVGIFIGNMIFSIYIKINDNKDKRKQSLIDNYYNIEHGTCRMIIIGILAMIFLVLSIIFIFDYFINEVNNEYIIVCSCMCYYFCAVVFLKTIYWKIKVDGNFFTYRKNLMAIKSYSFDDITEIQIKKNNNMIVYINKKKILVVPKRFCNSEYFRYTAMDYGVKIIKTRKSKLFRKIKFLLQ